MHRPLRVLYVNQSGVAGGAAKSLLRLLETLDRSEVEPHLAAPDGPVAQAAAELNISFYPLPRCRMYRRSNPFTLLRSLWRFHRFSRALRRVCRQVQPDLVHGNSLAAAWAAVNIGKYPVIWHVRDLRSPGAIMRLVRKKAARVIAISKAVAERIEQEAPEGAPVQLIYNGLTERDTQVTRSREEMRREWGVDAQAPMIGCMAQIVAWKRQDLLLRALPLVIQKVPEARLVFLGADLFGDSTEYAQYLRRLVEELQLTERVIWAGHLPSPQDALAAVDVVAHPTDCEPLGRVVLEALALGTPVVAVNRAGPSEIIKHMESGVLVPPDDCWSLAEGVVQVLQDRELAARLREGGLARARDFRAADLAPAVVRVYDEVCAARHGGGRG